MEEDIKREVVIDASVILAKMMPDEKVNDELGLVYKNYEVGSINFLAPVLLKYEIANALKSAVLQKRLKQDVATKLFDEFLELPITFLETDFKKTLVLSMNECLSFYDAAYLSMAKDRKIKLITLDKKLNSMVNKMYSISYNI